MTQVVQAKCPYCKKMLRIPAEWVNQAMKCKHCQQVFQAKPRTGTPAAEGAAANTPMSPTPFTDADSPASGPSPRSSSRRRPRRWWKGALVCGVVLAIAGGVVIVAGPHMSGLFATKAKDTVDKKKVAPSKKPRLDPDAETVPAPDKKDTPAPTAKSKLETVTKLKTDDLPKNFDPPKKKGPDSKKKDPPISSLFPRRALLINVSNYLLFNPLHYGSGREDPRSVKNPYPGSSTAALLDAMSRSPMSIPGTQIIELSDAGRNAFSTSKAVIENTITEFVDTSRAQDRVIVLFTGHAIEIEKESYLVPVEGNREDAKTLVPLSWVYDKLGTCKARQKLLILDVFRFPPARGEELPGAGSMTDDFDAKLLAPPAGVQVWASCTKGQQSIELERGSVFLQALCTVLQERLPGIQEPSNPLPLEILVPKVNLRVKELLGPQKLEQVSRLSGTCVEEGGTPYNVAEPLPPRLVLKAVNPAGDKSAGLAMIKNILDEINRLPPVRASQKQVQAASLPGFSAKVLDEYKPDYKSWPELVGMAKDKEKYPLRAGVLEAIKVLNDSQKIAMKERLINPGGGAITPAIKKDFAASQKEPGVMIFQMETALADLKAAGEMRDKETSKRWLANYDYALARLQSRLVYLYEYNNILAQVRSDSLPPLEPFHDGWRVGSQKKVQISEPKVKDMVKNINKTWKRIADENPGTPWAILAARENMTALGLVWRASRN